MANQIHSSAIIGPDVKLGSNISVGPFTIIEGEVTIGNDVEIQSHCVIKGYTTIGDGTVIYPSAMVGNDPQDKKFQRGSKTCLEIGKNNVIREFTTINPGTLEGGGITKIGDNNLFMAYSHAAHDVRIGNDNIFANAATLAGHVEVQDRVVVGGLVGVHQFTKIGSMAMIGGCSRIVQDVPPFSLSVGVPALIYGINAVGLKRAKISVTTLRVLKDAFRILFNLGLAKSSAVERVRNELEMLPELEQLIQFVNNSERGLIGASTSLNGDA